MQKFLKNTCFFLLPFIVLLALIEGLIRFIPNDYSYKNYWLENKSKNLKTLVLGTSHSYYGVNPSKIQGKCFNAAYVSQSIDIDYLVLKNKIDKLSDLKFVVLPIDYNSMFNQLVRGVNSWRVKNYNIYYDFNLTYTLDANFELLNFKPLTNIERIFSYYYSGNSPRTSSELGFGIDERNIRNLDSSGIRASKAHTNIDASIFKENKEYVKKIIDLSNRNGFKILFYTSPAYKSYYLHFNPLQWSKTNGFAKRISRKHTNVRYKNFLTDSSFTSIHFRDADHLNKKGSDILTRKIDDLLKNF